VALTVERELHERIRRQEPPNLRIVHPADHVDQPEVDLVPVAGEALLGFLECRVFDFAEGAVVAELDLVGVVGDGRDAAEGVGVEVFAAPTRSAAGAAC
jgi:hypothetical protein